MNQDIQKLSVIIQDDVIAGTLLVDGKVVQKVVEDTNPNFPLLRQAIKDGDEKETIKFLMGYSETHAKLASAGAVNVTVSNGVIKADGHVLNNAMTDRVLRLFREGFNIDPLLAFIGRLMNNPSKAAVDELYLFLEANSLSITADGHFLAYKSVNENFTSIHDAKTDNSIGKLVSMPRNMVDDDRNRTCSKGLHFASLDYCKNFFVGDKILAVKIDPADVVSIPSDYNNQKGRACKYVPIAEVTDEVKNQNRDPLSESAVVDTTHFGQTGSYQWDKQKPYLDNLSGKAKAQTRDCYGRFA